LYERHLLDHADVVGCFVGHKRMGGRNTRRLAIICMVPRKKPASELAEADLIPNQLTWSRNTREDAVLPTDVQEVGDAGFHAAVAGPGDLVDSVVFPPASTTHPIVATIGVALRHPRYGLVVTTAGHTVQKGAGIVTYPPSHQPRVRVQNIRSDGAGGEFTGRVVRSARVEEADYALVVPDDGTPVGNLYRDQDAVSGLHIPAPEDVGKPFFALTRAGPRPARVRKVFGVITIGGFTLRDLIATDFVTGPGDSGCALIDTSFRVCGTLVGFATLDGVRRSLFASAFWPITMESAELF
jgi:hypothetical protein